MQDLLDEKKEHSDTLPKNTAVDDLSHLKALFAKGLNLRKVKKLSKKGHKSSRSHLVLIMEITDATDPLRPTKGKIQFVDLAG